MKVFELYIADYTKDKDLPELMDSYLGIYYKQVIDLKSICLDNDKIIIYIDDTLKDIFSDSFIYYLLEDYLGYIDNENSFKSKFEFLPEEDSILFTADQVKGIYDRAIYDYYSNTDKSVKHFPISKDLNKISIYSVCMFLSIIPLGITVTVAFLNYIYSWSIGHPYIEYYHLYYIGALSLFTYCYCYHKIKTLYKKFKSN